MMSETDLKGALELDAQFSKWKPEIDKMVSQLDRGSKVRMRVWVSKLNEPTNNPVWKKNRNLHARLLLEQLRSKGPLTLPFSSIPPEGPLTTLQPYLTYRFLGSAHSPRSHSPSPPGHINQQQKTKTAAPQTRSLATGGSFTKRRQTLARDRDVGKNYLAGLQEESLSEGERMWTLPQEPAGVQDIGGIPSVGGDLRALLGDLNRKVKTASSNGSQWHAEKHGGGVHTGGSGDEENLRSNDRSVLRLNELLTRAQAVSPRRVNIEGTQAAQQEEESPAFPRRQTSTTMNLPLKSDTGQRDRENITLMQQPADNGHTLPKGTIPSNSPQDPLQRKGTLRLRLNRLKEETELLNLLRQRQKSSPLDSKAWHHVGQQNLPQALRRLMSPGPTLHASRNAVTAPRAEEHRRYNSPPHERKKHSGDRLTTILKGLDSPRDPSPQTMAWSALRMNGGRSALVKSSNEARTSPTHSTSSSISFSVMPSSSNKMQCQPAAHDDQHHFPLTMALLRRHGRYEGNGSPQNIVTNMHFHHSATEMMNSSPLIPRHSSSATFSSQKASADLETQLPRRFSTSVPRERPPPFYSPQRLQRPLKEAELLENRIAELEMEVFALGRRMEQLWLMPAMSGKGNNNNLRHLQRSLTQAREAFERARAGLGGLRSAAVLAQVGRRRERSPSPGATTTKAWCPGGRSSTGRIRAPGSQQGEVAAVSELEGEISALANALRRLVMSAPCPMPPMNNEEAAQLKIQREVIEAEVYREADGLLTTSQSLFQQLRGLISSGKSPRRDRKVMTTTRLSLPARSAVTPRDVAYFPKKMRIIPASHLSLTELRKHYVAPHDQSLLVHSQMTVGEPSTAKPISPLVMTGRGPSPLRPLDLNSALHRASYSTSSSGPWRSPIGRTSYSSCGPVFDPGLLSELDSHLQSLSKEAVQGEQEVCQALLAPETGEQEVCQALLATETGEQEVCQALLTPKAGEQEVFKALLTPAETASQESSDRMDALSWVMGSAQEIPALDITGQPAVRLLPSVLRGNLLRETDKSALAGQPGKSPTPLNLREDLGPSSRNESASFVMQLGLPEDPQAEVQNISALFKAVSFTPSQHLKEGMEQLRQSPEATSTGHRSAEQTAAAVAARSLSGSARPGHGDTLGDIEAFRRTYAMLLHDPPLKTSSNTSGNQSALSYQDPPSNLSKASVHSTLHVWAGPPQQTVEAVINQGHYPSASYNVNKGQGPLESLRLSNTTTRGCRSSSSNNMDEASNIMHLQSQQSIKHLSPSDLSSGQYRAVRLQLRDSENFNQEVLNGFQKLKTQLGLRDHNVLTLPYETTSMIDSYSVASRYTSGADLDQVKSQQLQPSFGQPPLIETSGTSSHPLVLHSELKASPLHVQLDLKERIRALHERTIHLQQKMGAMVPLPTVGA